jgi:hypothetical protein
MSARQVERDLLSTQILALLRIVVVNQRLVPRSSTEGMSLLQVLQDDDRRLGT